MFNNKFSQQPILNCRRIIIVRSFHFLFNAFNILFKSILLQDFRLKKSINLHLPIPFTRTVSYLLYFIERPLMIAEKSERTKTITIQSWTNFIFTYMSFLLMTTSNRKNMAVFFSPNKRNFNKINVILWKEWSIHVKYTSTVSIYDNENNSISCLI